MFICVRCRYFRWEQSATRGLISDCVVTREKLTLFDGQICEMSLRCLFYFRAWHGDELFFISRGEDTHVGWEFLPPRCATMASCSSIILILLTPRLQRCREGRDGVQLTLLPGWNVTHQKSKMYFISVFLDIDGVRSLRPADTTTNSRSRCSASHPHRKRYIYTARLLQRRPACKDVKAPCLPDA